MADIGAPTMPDCIKDRTKQYFSCMISVLEEMSYASTKYFISSNKCTRKNCVLGSELEASKSKMIKTKVVFILCKLALWFSQTHGPRRQEI